MRIVCAVLLAAVALAQTPAEKKPAIVEGKIANSLNGEAIRKAELTLTTSLMPDGFDGGFGMDMSAVMGLEPEPDAKGPEPKVKEPKKTFTATSDANGKFRIEGVDPGNYYFKVKRTGFVEQTYKPTSANSAEGKLHLTSGQELHDIDFRLVPQGAVAGKVVDEDGDPVGDAMVTASKYSFASGHRTMLPTDTGQTNDRGEFRLGKLPPGRYYLCAEVMALNPMGNPAPPPPKDGSPETGYVATYFPRTIDVQDAESIEVKAGADIPGFVIHIQKSRVVRLKGNLIGADGKPLKQAQVVLMSGARPGSMRMASVNDPEGKFEIANVPPGTYMAMTMQLTGTNPTMTMQTLVVANENLSDVKLGTVPEATLSGKIVVAGDGKLELKGMTVMLEGEEEGPTMPASGKVDESGSFVVQKVAPSKYEVSVTNVPKGAYLKSVMWSGREKLGEALDFSAGVGGDLQVILGTDGASFDAKVTRDDKPAHDATVVLLPEDAGRRSQPTTRSQSTDDVGHVAFKDVPPGNYLAFAWEKVEEGDWFDPAFVKAAGNDGVRVTIGSKDNQHLDLKAIPAK
jgi:uncharacterized GH25 family protein